MFFDHVKIELISGNGGNGAVSFRREKYVPDGGPDGGDGGDGGSVFLVSTARKNTLIDFRFKHKFTAGHGEQGGKRKRAGKKGADLTLHVPLGTLVFAEESGVLIADLKEEGQTIRLLKGGKGGKGNVHFKSSVRQAPKFGRAGELGEELVVRLELRLVADCGLIGLPNAGKSSLLAALTAARPKIANYAFTTLDPSLGVVQCDYQSFVLEDLPGLIEGAAQGAGLGHTFLRHATRCKLLLHVLDISLPPAAVLAAYELINQELATYDQSLGERQQVIVFNKIDKLTAAEIAERLALFATASPKVYLVSALAELGLAELIAGIFNLLPQIAEPQIEQAPIEDWQLYRYVPEERFVITRTETGIEVSGRWIEGLIRSINFNDSESFLYFQRQIKDKGLSQALLEAGVETGEWITIAGTQFQFAP